MEQTITAKLQILVSPSDKQIICDTMKAYSDACNYVSEYIYKTHNLSRYSVQEDTYRQVREIYGLRSQMAISCVRTVIAKYKTILENQKEWIKPVFRLPQLDLVWNRDYSLKKDIFSVNTLNGRIKTSFYKNGFEQYFADDCKFGFLGECELVGGHLSERNSVLGEFHGCFHHFINMSETCCIKYGGKYDDIHARVHGHSEDILIRKILRDGFHIQGIRNHHTFKSHIIF